MASPATPPHGRTDPPTSEYTEPVERQAEPKVMYVSRPASSRAASYARSQPHAVAPFVVAGSVDLKPASVEPTSQLARDNPPFKPPE